MFLIHYIFLLSTLLLLQNHAYAAAIACNAVTEVSQTFNFSTTNTWPSGSTTRNYTIGTAPNNVTLTFTNTQAAGVTPMTGDPAQRTHGNIADTVTISSDGGEAAGALLSTFTLSPSRAINKLSFTITDEDSNTASGNNFRDRTVSTTNAGVTTAITPQVTANQTIVLGSGQATATNSADCAETDNSCNLYLEFNRTGITSASTEFRAAHTGTSTQQRIGFNQYAWCLPRMPTVKVQKITTGHTGAGGTFTFADTNLTGTIASISTTAPNTATPASPTALPATTIDTAVTITETPASGFALSSATCTDANSASTLNPASFGTLAGNVLTIPATNMRAGADITCTFTNRKTAQLTLRKTWTNAKVNDAVTVTTAGGTVNPSFASVANTANETDTGTATAVFAGETLTFSEPFSVGSAANYNASLSCTGATDTNLADGLTINAADTNIVCTYTNSRRTANLTARKTWTNGKINDAVNITTTGGLNNVNFNATANTVSETDTATAITVYAGDALTFAESFTTGTATNYNRTLACTGNTTALAGSVLTVNSADTNITCTYTNSRIAQSIRVDKQWTNSVTGHTATVTTTGGTNNPTFSSTAPTNTTGTAVTVYAGDVVTLPAETFGGGGTAIGYNTTVACTGGSTLASGAVGRTLTITNSATATVCTYNNTKLPTITLTKVSVDNNGIFSFSGTNGFGSDSITTSTSGVGVTGTTKILTSAAFTTSTVITETIPSNYTLTNIACSGLGSGGTATNNLSAGTVTLNTAATAAGANISCTFTNTANSSSGGSFPSQIACNAAEIGQTFEFNATNTWPSGTSSKSFVVGTAPNNVTVTFTNTQAVTAMSGDPSLRTYGNVANSLTISSNGGLASNTLIATLGLTPSRAINKLSYSIYDSDYYNSGGFNFRDRTVSTSSAGNPTTITAQNATNETISGNTTTATTSADCGANDANCNLYFAYNLNGITSASTRFYAAHASGTSTQQLIAFNQYAWCLPKHPTVTISKTTNGGTGSFSFTNTNLASASTNLTTATAGTAVSSTAMNVTSLASNVQIQETVPSGWQLASASCTDANGALTTNGTGTFGSLAGSTLTIPSANLVYGADIRCSFTNQKVVPLTLRKTWVNAITNDAVNVTSSGGTVNPSLSSVANTANETDTATVANVYVADTLTFSEGFTTGNSANYNSALSCTGATDTNLADGLTINTADSAITCTYTNTRKTATFRLAKAWGANSISGNVANLGATTGLTNNTTAFTSTASTNTTETSITVYAGETVTLPAETMSTGTLSNYNTVLSCTADAGATANTLSGTNGQVSNTLLIGAGDEGKAIVCTYTNTRIAQNLTLVKQWTNAATGHTATVTTTGGTNNSTFNATAPSTGLTGTTVTVYAGDVVTLPVETFGGGASVSDYNSTVACTGGSTLVSGAVGRSVTISNSTTATTCTYSNTGLSDMVPTLTYMPNTGIVGSPYYGKFTCTNNGIAPATAGATCAISLPAGLSATCSPTVPTASTVAVGASINCTVTGTPTTSGSGTLVLTTGATNDSNGGTTTGGNNQVSQAITIVDSTTAPTCSPGSTTNLLSSAGTELYFSDNTATPITNNFGLIASPATYVRTGSNFVVKGDWRWRNANPAAGSPAMTYQLIVNGTVYAQLVGTPSGQEVGTLTALNGATLDGGLSTMQLYDFSVSGLAALPVGVTLPSTVTSISTLSMSFVSSTTPADGAGLAPTVLNACALPKLTLSKVSQGGVGAFAFTGNNGFSNETITTTVAGTSVAGTTQTLSAVSTTTTISETIPSGYNVTDISCTGLGSGNATPNLSTGSVTISNTALVYGANIACTYTNTKLPTITISKISQGGIGSFSFTGTNGFASQNITTSSAGVAVAGATQTLNAAATATTITETIPSGYTVTDISCTGLGAGTATPNLVSGSVSLNAAATAAGANIACTFTNTKLPTITISKISQGGTGTFSFTGTNGFASQNITTSSAGVAVAGATQTLSAVSTTTTITETIPSGYTVTDISCTGLGAGSATPNLVGGSVSLNAAATAAGANIACTFTNTASAFTITGKVFLDNGKNSATPHNGIQEVDEQGIGNALVRLTNCSSTVYQTTVTDGSGGYTLSIPNSLSAGTTLCVEEYQQPANLVSVSGNVGTTGGSYTLATDKVQFILAASTNYTGVNFGDVVQSQLTGTGNQTIPAGTTASYGHQFIAGTEGSVTFSTAQAPTPLLAWTSLVYLDANCNALLDGGDTQITSAINVVADQVVCLVQKVVSPSTATNGSQNISTIGASFVYTAPSAIVANFSQPDTTIIMDSGLVLVKKVREVSSCPSTGADTNLFTTNNQALPNAFIEYQIVYSNPSANVVSNIVINDMTPSFTTFRSASCRTTPSSVLCSVASSPSVGGVGSLQWVLTNNPTGLGSGQSGEVRFCVRVDQ